MNRRNFFVVVAAGIVGLVAPNPSNPSGERVIKGVEIDNKEHVIDLGATYNGQSGSFGVYDVYLYDNEGKLLGFWPLRAS